MVRAGTAYRKIWRLVNNFFARIIRFTVQKFQLFWVIFCIIIFFIELWHILILWLAKMPNGGMPVFTLIATGWRYRKIFFYKKTLQNTIIMWPRNASYGQDAKGQGQGRTLTKMEFLVSEFCNQLCCGLSLFLTLFVAELDPTKKNVTWIVFSASCRSQA